MIFPINLPVQEGRFSDDELFAFCRMNPNLRIERGADGQILISTPDGLAHSFPQRIVSQTEARFVELRRTKLGRVSDSNGGYTLPDSSMRAPDVAWVSNERLAPVSANALKKFANLCPDFVIELASESDELTHLRKKMVKFIDNGVRLGWLVDPFAQQTIIYRPDAEPETKPFADELNGEDVLPGFTLRLRDLLE